MAASAGAHVLLEAVAPVPHEDQPSTGAGCQQTHGDLDGHQQQKLLAFVEVAGNASWDDERLVESAGTGEYP